ncbi:LLM class flavin-dependent oxidoreductase [Roseomonas sp. HJA6]|uniref:LLM class flavin-dependent oxidoreductase n=1 Tax=Roseomonas alba TaxID=2846776 RepID=A0ABS7A7I8_9PROT|nr:LLM class flavin-dependent oxidoreductase [Neoroseomonas alba]MBW6398211.1 LLM class flavin-dependent oxidoreductase [Neoroseomonas alba]
MMMPLGISLSAPAAVTDFDQVLAAAQAAEAAGFDFLCLPERPGLDPIALAAALAAGTERIGLVPSCSAPFHQPYNLARRLGSIDHISQGRFGWALQPAPPLPEIEHFAHLPMPASDIAVPRAAELAGIVAALWDSWDDDAFLRDKASGMYFDRAKFHWLNHEGAHYRVRGPLDTARPPQGRPPMMVLGGTTIAHDLACAAAEILHSLPRHLADARATRAGLQRGLAEQGRSADALCILAGIAPTSADVQPGPLRVSETPAMIAALMGEWRDTGAVDGFIIHLSDSPEAITQVAMDLMPALRERGLRDALPPRSPLRDRLGLHAAPSRYAA